MFIQAERFTIISKYTPGEIVERLLHYVDSDEVRFVFIAPFSRAQFIGLVTSSYIRLRVRENFRNIFKPALTATVEPTPTGSVVHCRIGLMPLSIVFLTAQAMLFPLLVCCLMVSAISDALTGENYWVSLGAALFFLALCSSFVLNGWYLSRGERDQLRAFIIKELAEG